MLSFGQSHNDEIAAIWTKAALKKWLGEEKSAGDVFDFVLKRHREYFLETPDLNTWVSYVMMLDKGDPYKTMFMVLQKRFDTATLDRMLDNPETIARMRVLAQKLQKELRLSQSL
ncbi:hypothetical protein PF005_g14376 [Phytophthora fragariae]|uniref:RXLR phytopathogen effector protein WY-domain domain-containing protein n=1 Tax=Phytophthora fragariae TaxID=53985 RepID=A0A6A4DJT6_9STRA|nr:hypothetical protein PF009_g7941 [Phytophthora fragariae]KAE9102218.1 hypothetical protein PF007_g14841 [Phytophthora fragariae]KAE9103119.1 hypothetical protein PF010_g13851 [Phytophthora fragariae]KAE9140466.1 hypothetical protein PF006_g13520 [Phytophthora fragariae]KAE9202970.1 hypothetical protein PF005_g14376 [Phytophthora fragariae]